MASWWQCVNTLYCRQQLVSYLARVEVMRHRGRIVALTLGLDGAKLQLTKRRLEKVIKEKCERVCR